MQDIFVELRAERIAQAEIRLLRHIRHDDVQIVDDGRLLAFEHFAEQPVFLILLLNQDIQMLCKIMDRLIPVAVLCLALGFFTAYSMSRNE